MTLRADTSQPVQGSVTFIYPELKPETRTVPVRIELPNPEQRLRTSMYADVVFQAGGETRHRQRHETSRAGGKR